MKLTVNSITANQSATLPIRWCLEPGERELFLARKLDPANAYLLVVILSENGHEVGRELVKLNELMHFITFKTVGRHTIKAAIILPLPGEQINTSSLLRVGVDPVISTKNQNFFNKEHFQFIFDVEILEESVAEVEVTVDKSFFAKKPFDWRWVNFWYESNPADQCQFRKRRFVAYTIQPILCCLWYFILAPLFKISYILATLCWGIRPDHINWKALRFFEDINDIAEGVDDFSDYIKYRGKRDKYGFIIVRENSVFVELFRPLWILLIAVSETLVFLRPGPSSLFIHPAFYWLALMIPVLVGRILLKNIKESANKERIGKRQEISLEEKIIKEIEIISCATNPDSSARVGALPKPKQSASLRFLTTKAKLCKPFAVN